MDNTMTYKRKRNANRSPAHPGEFLREELLPEIAMSKTAFADNLGISRQHLYDLLSGKKPVSADVAARLGAAFGDGAGVWLRMQAAYDAWHAERETDLSRIKRVA
jgi:addiction module HigA family antidote